MADRIVLTDRQIGRIDPNLHGHFAEHLGRCIYGGLWVDDGPPAETVDGLRADTLELLADLDIPMLRWPGGCFADDYDWTDGIGPRENRPRTRNAHWTQGRANVPEESNAFGTHEFLTLCEHLECEPYLAANVGTGSPDLAADWVEYCNYDGDTDLVDRRRENGRIEPWDVRYWGVGNENWGCGGNFTPENYAHEYRRFATYLRSLRSPMDIELDLVACGHFAGDWNDAFLETLGEDVEMVDHLSVHRYYSAGHATDFSSEEYYELFANSRRLLADIDAAAETIDDHAPPEAIGVAVDEWGVWHPVAENDNGLEQPNTVRDAISAAGILDGFNNRADVISMANLAQTVNVLQCLVQTDQESAWATPTYRVFELHRPHRNRQATAVEMSTERVQEDEEMAVPLLTASASRDSTDWYITLSNRDLDARAVSIDVDGHDPTVTDATVLFGHADPAAYPTGPGETPSPTMLDTATEGGSVTLSLPGSSVAGVRLT